MALDATPGGPTSNAYCTVAQATAFMQERLDTDAWYETDPEDLWALTATREAALIWATRLLDEQIRWVGTPTTTTQALGWPRTGVTDPQGRAVDPTTIPVTIQRATADYALALMADASASTGGMPAGTVKRRKLGDTEVEYFDPGTAARAATTAPGTTLPMDVRQMLRGWGLAIGGIVVSLIRA